jgi:hypothetical protein
MTRSQALTLSVLVGFVLLVCGAMVVLIFFPYERLIPPTPTPTLPPPTATAIPTLPNYLPAPNTITPEPTATNTRLPTATPQPPKPPTPTVVFVLPTRRPTATPTRPPETPSPEDTPLPDVTATPPGPRQYSIFFIAKKDTLVKGECTDLRWEVTGAASVSLDGESVSQVGVEKVCPKSTVSYRLTVQLPNDTQFLHQTVKITVKEEEN